MKKRTAIQLGQAAIGVGAATLAYGLVHAHSYRLRRRSMLIPSDDVGPLRILHISDAHTLVRHSKRLSFLRDLGDCKPDLVVATGDMIAEDEALAPVLDALDSLLDVPGVFVFGSNDYVAPVFKNPLRYLVGPSNRKLGVESDNDAVPLAWREMRSAFMNRGWVDLNNKRARLEVAGWTLDFVGVDDPHMDYDHFPAPQPSPTDGVNGPYARIGVTHAPYTRVLDQMVDDGCSLIFAGHTHGGQVCLPGGRALVSNCDLDPKLASGLFQWPLEADVRADSSQPDDNTQAEDNLPSGSGSQPGSNAQPGSSGTGEPVLIKGDGAVIAKDAPGSAWVQVSAGIGASTYAPVRTFCPPEAILLDIVPVGSRA